METIIFSTDGDILTTPEQVLVAFCTTYTREEAQQELWRWVFPTLLECFRQHNPHRAEKLGAFYEQLEKLLNAVYALRPGCPDQQEGGNCRG